MYTIYGMGYVDILIKDTKIYNVRYMLTLRYMYFIYTRHCPQPDIKTKKSYTTRLDKTNQLMNPSTARIHGSSIRILAISFKFCRFIELFFFLIHDYIPCKISSCTRHHSVPLFTLTIQADSTISVLWKGYYRFVREFLDKFGFYKVSDVLIIGA